MPVVRPKIAELAFQVYGRTLHPELYEVLQTRTVERNGFQAKVDITSAGHVVTWRPNVDRSGFGGQPTVTRKTPLNVASFNR